MSHIDQRIENWRDALRRSETFGAGDLDELEDHLRDEITNLATVGLSEDEAFDVARRRLGSVDALDTEFRKINDRAIWARRIQWMLAGYLAVLFVRAAIQVVGGVSVSIGAAYGMTGSGLAVVYGSACAAGTAGFLFLLTAKTRTGVLSFVDRAQKWARSLKGALFILATAVLVVAVGRILLAAPAFLTYRYLGTQELAVFSVWSGVLNLIVAVLMPAMLLAVIIAIDRRYRIGAIGGALGEQ